MKRALIIGIDSSIGSALQTELLNSGCEVFGTTRRTSGLSQNVSYLDLSNLFEFRFEPSVDTVFLCASITKVATCRSAPELCQTINVDAQVQLTEYFLAKGAHVIFLSTNAVFNGEKPAYGISDQTCPITTYGESKATAEKKLLSLSNDLCIVRLTKVLTPDYPLICHWINELKHGRVIEPFHDLYISPISINIVTLCLREVMEKKLRGLIHLSGNSVVSYQCVATYLADMLGVSHSLIQSKSALLTGLDAPPYASLDMNEMKALFKCPVLSFPAVLNHVFFSQCTAVNIIL